MASIQSSSSNKSGYESYIIVGAGNFGAATALALRKKFPECTVTLIDSEVPNPRAASHDINKIVRDDYPETPYMSIMLKAMKSWTQDSLYAPYFHQTGYLRVDTGDFSDRAMQTYKELGVENGAEWLSVDEVCSRFPQFSTANFDGANRVFWLPHAGWANAVRALTAVNVAAINQGVRFHAGHVTQLLVRPDGDCNGVQLKSGEQLHADCILLAAGANTGVILANTFPTSRSHQAGERLTAAGAVSFSARLPEQHRQKFKNVPVIKSCLKHTDGEGMSMTPDGVLKFNMAKSFTNLQMHELSQQEMSVPDRENPARFTWTEPENFPMSLRTRCERVLRGLYGEEVKDVNIEAFRICWDAETPFHDFTITPHTHVPHLHIATGGSFHGWKFLPVIGEYIASMLDGSLDPTLAALWHWDAQIGANAEADRVKVLGAMGSLAMSGHGYGDIHEDINGEDHIVHVVAGLSDSGSETSSRPSLRDSSHETEPSPAPEEMKKSKGNLANPTYKTDCDLADLLHSE